MFKIIQPFQISSNPSSSIPLPSLFYADLKRTTLFSILPFFSSFTKLLKYCSKSSLSFSFLFASSEDISKFINSFNTASLRFRWASLISNSVLFLSRCSNPYFFSNFFFSKFSLLMKSILTKVSPISVLFALFPSGKFSKAFFLFYKIQESAQNLIILSHFLKLRQGAFENYDSTNWFFSLQGGFACWESLSFMMICYQQQNLKSKFY